MGKVLSTLRKAFQDQERVATKPHPPGWTLRRVKKDAKELVTKEKESIDIRQEKATEKQVIYAEKQKKIGERFESAHETGIYNEQLKEKGLNDSNIGIINRLSLSRMFFTDVDQNQGCSFWSEETLYMKYAALRRRKQLRRRLDLIAQQRKMKEEAKIAKEKRDLCHFDKNASMKTDCTNGNNPKDVVNVFLKEKVIFDRANEAVSTQTRKESTKDNDITRDRIPEILLIPASEEGGTRRCDDITKEGKVDMTLQQKQQTIDNDLPKEGLLNEEDFEGLLDLESQQVKGNDILVQGTGRKDELVKKDNNHHSNKKRKEDYPLNSDAVPKECDLAKKKLDDKLCAKIEETGQEHGKVNDCLRQNRIRIDIANQRSIKPDNSKEYGEEKENLPTDADKGHEKGYQSKERDCEKMYKKIAKEEEICKNNSKDEKMYSRKDSNDFEVDEKNMISVEEKQHPSWTYSNERIENINGFRKTRCSNSNEGLMRGKIVRFRTDRRTKTVARFNARGSRFECRSDGKSSHEKAKSWQKGEELFRFEELLRIDGLLSHLSYFSPRFYSNSKVTLARAGDALELPLVGIITKEGSESITANVLVNYSLITRRAEEIYKEMNSTVMLESIRESVEFLNQIFCSKNWSFTHIEDRNHRHHGALSCKITLQKPFQNLQCSLQEAKTAGLC